MAAAEGTEATMLAGLVAELPLPVCVLDTEGFVVSVSAVGARSGDVTGPRRLEDVWPAEVAGAVTAVAAQLAADGLSATPREVVTAGAGAPWRVRLVPLRGAEALVGVGLLVLEAPTSADAPGRGDRGVQSSVVATRLALALRRLSQELAAADDVLTMARIVAAAIPTVLGTRSSGVVLLDEERAVLKYVVMEGFAPEVVANWETMPVSLLIPLVDAHRSGNAHFLPDLDAHAGWPASVEPARAAGIVATASVPLVADGRSLGVLALAWSERRELTDAEHTWILTVASHVALAVRRAQAAAAERRVLTDLQTAMAPRLPSRVGNLALQTAFRPAGRTALVGGDFADALTLADGRHVLVVGDVVGHGLAAAGTMNRLRYALRDQLLLNNDPAHVLAGLDADLYDGDLATMLVVTVDDLTGVVHAVSAGHLPPRILSAGGELFEVACPLRPPLGAGALPTYDDQPSRVATLRPGDSLLLLTDGVVETRLESLDVGLERFDACAVAHQHDDLETLADTLVDLADGHDDALVLVARLHAATG